MSREVFQLATLIIFVANALIMAIMVWRGIIAWRWTALPGIITLEIILFYVYVLFLRGSSELSATSTSISAIIRLQSGAAAFVFLVVYWKSRRNG